MKYDSERQELFSMQSTLNSLRRPDKGKSLKIELSNAKENLEGFLLSLFYCNKIEMGRHKQCNH